MRKPNLLFLTLAVVLGFAMPVRADEITIAITAQVANVSDPYNWLEGKFQAGDTLTGYYTYDSSVPNTSDMSNRGEYAFYSSPYGITVAGNGVTFRTNPSNVNFEIRPWNDDPQDYYRVISTSNSPLWNGTSVTEIDWMLENDFGTAIDNVLLPATAPILSNWPDNGFGVHGGPDKQPFFIGGTVTSAVLTPEPCSILLLLAGFALSRRTNK